MIVTASISAVRTAFPFYEKNSECKEYNSQSIYDFYWCIKIHKIFSNQKNLSNNNKSISYARLEHNHIVPLFTVLLLRTLLFTPFSVTCKNSSKIAFGNGIFALLNHFLTDFAVNAKSCVNSNIKTVL